MAVVNILTLVSKTQIEKGRYALSFDVTPKKKTASVIEKRKKEEQVYKDFDFFEGSCSPEICLKLKNKQANITFSVVGALKPRTPFEKGENVLEFNEALGECRKLLNLVPTNDVESNGDATIKFKVDESVKHVVYIHDVPIQRSSSSFSWSLRSTGSNSSAGSFDSWSQSSTGSRSIRGAYRQISTASSQSYPSLPTAESENSVSDNNVDAGSVHEHLQCVQGGAVSGDSVLHAKPVPSTLAPDQFDQNGESNEETPRRPTFVPPPENQQGMSASVTPVTGPSTASTVPTTMQQVPSLGNPVSSSGYTPPSQASASYTPSPVVTQAIAQSSPSPSASYGACDQTSSYSTASSSSSSASDYNDYDKILCNESLLALVSAMSPSDAHTLIIRLGVPSAVHQGHMKNHSGDVVSGYFDSLVYWRSTCKSKKVAAEAESKHMFNDLLEELDDMGRKDLKRTINQALDEGRRLAKKDFRHF